MYSLCILYGYSTKVLLRYANCTQWVNAWSRLAIVCGGNCYRSFVRSVRSILPFIDEKSALPSPSSLSSSVQADGFRFPSFYRIEISPNPWFSFVSLEFLFRYRLKNKRLPTKGPSDEAIRSARRRKWAETVEGQSRTISRDTGGGGDSWIPRPSKIWAATTTTTSK